MTMTIGLVINPVAGVGGPAGLKGSDGADIQAEARAKGVQPRAAERTREALSACAAVHAQLRFKTWGGPMGEHVLEELGLPAEVLGYPDEPSSAADTRRAARALAEAGVDLLMFVGGDGTARDLIGAAPPALPVIGVPAGVKMHSAVFGVAPRDVGEVIIRLVRGGLVAADVAEVRDVDEAALRAGRTGTKFFGELRVPRIGGFLQHVKSAGREVEALVLGEIAAEMRDRIEAHEGTVLLGPGSTVLAVKQELGIDGTLLGFDAMRAGSQIGKDLDAGAVEALVEPDTRVVLTFTRGQGFLLGRGNQQLTAEVIRRLGRDRLWIIASRTKVLSLEGRPLLVDTGDARLDESLAGIVEVITGFEDVCYYRIGR